MDTYNQAMNYHSPKYSVPSSSRKQPALLNLIKGKPVLAIFEFTLMCNSACGYCDLPLNQKRYELGRAEIKRIFTDLYRSGIRHIFIQGGEPLVRKDLPDVLEDLAALGFALTLVTNGTRFTSELVARLAKLPVSISVSLDTLNREQYQRIRGRDQLPQVLAGLELLKDFPNPKHLTCIVSEQNRHDVKEVAGFARARGFTPIIGAYHWDVLAYGKADAELIYERETVAAVFKDLLTSNAVPRGYVRNYVKDNLHWLEGKKLNACDAGKYSIAIDASGKVSACLAMPQAGNLRQQNLDQILRSLDRTAIKDCSDQSSCNILCSRVVGSKLRHPLANYLGKPSV
jgi:MoaA/NifB/PqqE/SkfB family radical SAM enzyme